MDTKVARRVPDRSGFSRLGGLKYVKNQVCTYWLAGRCNRNPCRFLHLDSTNLPPQVPKRSSSVSKSAISGVKNKMSWRNPKYSSSKSSTAASKDDQCGIKSKSTLRNHKYMNAKNMTTSANGGVSSGDKIGRERESLVSTGADSDMGSIQKTLPKLCQYWVTGNCVQGDKCKNLHSWFSGSGFSLLTKLEGHKKAITGIVLPSGSDKLFSSSKDESVRIWDCHSGQCVNSVTLGSESECLITEGPWVFVGLKDSVKAWNFSTKTEHVLNGPNCPNSRVYAMVVDDDNVLFAGVEDGSILAWKISFESHGSEVFAALKGHSLAVISLVVAANNRLYSGSKDNTIRVWDRKNLQCLEILNGHTDFVTAVICWDRYLFSGSLDNTLKAWAATENGNLEVVYEVKEESGVLALCGLPDAKGKPILLCSCKDNAVGLYDLPSFTERGRIFSKGEILTIDIGCGGLFFTGDATGELSVWQLNGELQVSKAS